jgi:hypothetical protein
VRGEEERRLTHMRLDEMTSGESRHERQLSSHDRSSDDPGESPSVVAWRVRVGSGDAEHLEAGVLRGYEGHAHRGLDILGGILSGGKEDGLREMKGKSETN